MERFLDFFTPKSYKLKLFINKHTKELTGIVTISGKTKVSDIVKLHSVGLDIRYVKIDGKMVEFTLENDALGFHYAPKSPLTVEISYTGKIKEDMQGAYLSTYEYEGKEERIVSTQFESHYARECFPCVDEPAAKATFDLEITVPDQDDIVLANTEPVISGEMISFPSESDSTDKTANLDKCYTWHFQTTPKMSTYLLAFAIGRFNYVEGGTKTGVTVRTYAPLNQCEDLLELPNRIAIESLEYYDNLFKIPYPLTKLDQVAIPDFEAGAMENWGLVTYRESQFLCNEASSIAVKKAATLTITHELSHQWFGNLVTMKWWNDLWLNESFATIMQYYATDHLFPEFRAWFDFFTSDCLSALYRDAIQGVQAVREEVNDPAEIATLFDPCIVYAKGAHLMFMLIREMGEPAFYKGIHEYFEKNQYKNAEAGDLWASLEPYAKGFSVRDFMTAWITKPGYPVVTDEAQQRFLLDGSSDDTIYPIPEVKDDMSGHYLINLSGPEFAEALENFKSLMPEQRIRLLIDRLLLSETPIVSTASLIPLISKFKSEISAPIWEIIGGIVSKMTIFIDYDSPEEKKYKSYIYSTIKPALDKLELVPKEKEELNDSELRITLLVCAIYSKDPEIIDELCALYSSDYDKIPHDIRPFVFSAKMWRDEETFYPEVKKAYRTTDDPELKADLRSALAKPRLEKNIDFAFSLLKEQTLLKPQDHLSFLLRLRRWRYTRDRALDWMLKNWDYIYQINGEKSIEDYPRYFASTIDRAEDADKFFDFFTPLSSNPVLARALKVAKNDIESTLSLIASDKSSVLSSINNLK